MFYFFFVMIRLDVNLGFFFLGILSIRVSFAV